MTKHNFLTLYLKIKTFLISFQKNVNKNFWSNRDLESIKKYWANRQDLNNEFLYKLFDRVDFSSVLEIGSNCGNRLYQIAKRRPDVSFLGIDINKTAVDYGNQQYQAESIDNLKLRCMEAWELDPAVMNSFDIVFSWATLIYIYPAEIEDVLIKMFCVAKKAVILLEIHDESLLGYKQSKGVLVSPHNWNRNYKKLFQQIGVPEQQLTVEDIPRSVWNPGGGNGRVVMVVKDG